MVNLSMVERLSTAEHLSTVGRPNTVEHHMVAVPVKATLQGMVVVVVVVGTVAFLRFPVQIQSASYSIATDRTLKGWLRSWALFTRIDANGSGQVSARELRMSRCLSDSLIVECLLIGM
jgi:hypothetical protein